MVGGIPHPVMVGGGDTSSSDGGGYPIQSWWGGYSIQSWWGVPHLVIVGGDLIQSWGLTCYQQDGQSAMEMFLGKPKTF